MSIIRRAYIVAISSQIWIIERVFFYPKLASVYKNLKLYIGTRGSLTIFDVGANRGQSVRFFKNLYPNSNIYTFEPSTSSSKKLKKFIEHKQYEGIFMIPIAFGNSQKEMLFYESDLSETSTFTMPNQDSRNLKIKNLILLQKQKNSYIPTPVQMTTLDNFVYVNKIDAIDILKIDVEGYELEVLLGASNTLRLGKVKVVQIEVHDSDLYKDNFPEIKSILKQNRFLKFKEIKHPFGNFREILYLRQ